MAADPFEPKSKRAGDGDHYIIAGEKYPRVTSILDLAPGSHLLAWHAKEAALSAASIAYQLGGDEDLDDAAVLEFREKRAPYSSRSESDGLAEIRNWRSIMREAERYRDYRAWVGSTMHHAIYQFALGARIAGNELIEWLGALGQKENLVPEPSLARFEEYGVDIYRKIAFDAKPYFESCVWFVETVQPEWLMNGLETCIYNPDEMYAGTADVVMNIDASRWESAGFCRLPIPRVRLLGDWKSSKSLSKNVLYQMSAYAEAPLVHFMQTGESVPAMEVDGVVALHVTPFAEKPVTPKLWGRWNNPDPVTSAYLAFCNLNAWYRAINDMPRAERSRVLREPNPKAPKVGARPCPF